MIKNEIYQYKVWDRAVRLFHWVNVLVVLGLLAVGTVIMYSSDLGVGTAGKITLKSLHIWLGYVFATNLLVRILWGFGGGPYARWGRVLPFGRRYLAQLKSYFKARLKGESQHFLGHNPLGRISVMVLFLLLASQAATGLVLAGTDMFYPPFGGFIKDWIAAPGVDPAELVPYAKEMYDPVAYDAMRAFRAPFIKVHVYGVYTLLAMIVLHVAAVVVVEIRDGDGLVSAMISGRKTLAGPPQDGEDDAL